MPIGGAKQTRHRIELGTSRDGKHLHCESGVLRKISLPYPCQLTYTSDLDVGPAPRSEPRNRRPRDSRSIWEESACGRVPGPRHLRRFESPKRGYRWRRRGGTRPVPSLAAAVGPHLPAAGHTRRSACPSSPPSAAILRRMPWRLRRSPVAGARAGGVRFGPCIAGCPAVAWQRRYRAPNST